MMALAIVLIAMANNITKHVMMRVTITPSMVARRDTTPAPPTGQPGLHYYFRSVAGVIVT